MNKDKVEVLFQEWDVIIPAVRRHAVNNYDIDGWDYVVECWDDLDIIRAAGGAHTADEAITNVKKVVRVMDSRRKDVEGYSGRTKEGL